MHFTHCRVFAVTYKNDKTGYAVLKLSIPDTPLPVTAVGYMPSLNKGLTISVSGSWKTHLQYGKQFLVEQYIIEQPDTEEGIVFFLSSGVIAKIGEVKARSIVDAFGEDTLAVLDNSPEKLLRVRGIGKKLLHHIESEWKKNRNQRELMYFFREFSLSSRLIGRIIQKFGDNVRELISKNPYLLSEEISGIGFHKADSIAQKMGFEQDSFWRIRAGFFYTLVKMMDNGHCCLPEEVLLDAADQVLSVHRELLVNALEKCVVEKILIRDSCFIYLPNLYTYESLIASQTLKRVRAASKSCTVKNKIESWLHDYEKREQWKGDEFQKKVVYEVLNKQLVLLTGGPGTGKTTVLKVIVHLFEYLKLSVLLAAPTGRAAQRMSESTGRKAVTIHRLLEYSPARKNLENPFIKNETNPLEAALLIVDETSMIDIRLMYYIYRATGTSTKLLLVGDNDQLPAVGPGNILSDLIISGVATHVRLQKVFRQHEKSTIITAAHTINCGNIPQVPNLKEDNLFFLEQQSPEEVLKLVVALITKRLPERYGYHPLNDIQVLSPMHKGLLGTESINQTLRTEFGKDKKGCVIGKYRFFVGEKVMQIKNNYEQNLFNGDIGHVSRTLDNETIEIMFNGEIHRYGVTMLDQIVSAYCISIHKSQGSEFKAIIIPLMMQHYIMLQRNLLYTAITRAKNQCILIGEKKALYRAVRNFETEKRYTLLGERLRRSESYPEKESFKKDAE